MSFPPNNLGFYMGAQGAPPRGHGGPRRLRCFRANGRRMGQDDFGNLYDLGDDDDELGGEDDDELGGEDEDFGAMDAIDELHGDVDALEMDAEDLSDDEFGAREDRLDEKLYKLKDKLEKLQNRKAKVRAKWRKRLIQNKMDKVVSEMRSIKGKLNRAKAKKKASNRKAAVAVAAGAALLAGGAAGGALATRDGVNMGRSLNNPLNNPAVANQIRQQQMQAGLIGQYASPAGSGRKIKLPFYAAGSTNPRNALTVPSGGISAATALTTEDISWAMLKIVGFTTTTYGTNSAAGAMALVEDLKTKGNANLFIHENAAPAQDYAAEKDDFTGLRAYPILRSPNQATVNVYATGDDNDVVIVSCSLVCDVLTDDVFGEGFPGPYAG